MSESSFMHACLKLEAFKQRCVSLHDSSQPEVHDRLQCFPTFSSFQVTKQESGRTKHRIRDRVANKLHPVLLSSQGCASSLRPTPPPRSIHGLRRRHNIVL